MTWGAPTNISANTDVSLHGTLVAAYNFGGTGVAATTVNGVTFQPFPISGAANTYTVGNYTFKNVDTFETIAPAATSTWQPLTLAYQGLLTTAVDLNADRELTLTLSGLTPGQTYEFQTWVNNSNRQNGFNNFLFRTSVSDDLGNFVNVYAGDDGTVRGISQVPGQFVIGTFTADAASQNVRFANGEINGVVNGFQLRQIPPPVIPEPGTALFGFALLSAASLTRRGR